MDRLFRLALPLLCAASLGALAVALFTQFVIGLEPCPLCLYQRAPYVAAAVVCAAPLLGAVPERTALALAAMLFAAGAGIAGYHVGVEQAWWASAVCDGGVAAVETGADLMAALQQPGEKPCDEVDAALFGVSMATYNLAASLALAAFALAARARRAKPGAPA
jgi:disulfide bond formation protein DsbB